MQKRNATVAVIGAGDYIGAEIAKKFSAEGFSIFAGRRNGDKLAPLVKEIEAVGGEIHARSLDARKEEEIISALGPIALDNPDPADAAGIRRGRLFSALPAAEERLDV
jgi:short-subunit dehydrogenase